MTEGHAKQSTHIRERGGRTRDRESTSTVVVFFLLLFYQVRSLLDAGPTLKVVLPSQVTGPHANHSWKHLPGHTKKSSHLISQASLKPIKLTIKVNGCKHLIWNWRAVSPRPMCVSVHEVLFAEPVTNWNNLCSCDGELKAQLMGITQFPGSPLWVYSVGSVRHLKTKWRKGFSTVFCTLTPLCCGWIFSKGLQVCLVDCDGIV